MSLIPRFHDNTRHAPPIKFETRHQGKDAERLKRAIWNLVIRLLLEDQEWRANLMLKEFDESPLSDAPLN